MSKEYPLGCIVIHIGTDRKIRCNIDDPLHSVELQKLYVKVLEEFLDR